MIRVHQVGRAQSTLAEAVLGRMRAFARRAPMGTDPSSEVRRLTTAWDGGSEGILLVAFLKGADLIGHAVAEVCGECLVVHQAQLDGPAGDALARGILLADGWGRTQGAKFMLMAADDRPQAWVRRYGFELSRYLMGRRLGTPIPALRRHAAA